MLHSTSTYNHQFPLINMNISTTVIIQNKLIFSSKNLFVTEKHKYKEIRTSLAPFSWKMTTRPPRSPTAKWSPLLSNSIAEITSTASRRNGRLESRSEKSENERWSGEEIYCRERLHRVVYRRRPERISSPERRPATKRKSPSWNSYWFRLKSTAQFDILQQQHERRLLIFSVVREREREVLGFRYPHNYFQ